MCQTLDGHVKLLLFRVIPVPPRCGVLLRRSAPRLRRYLIAFVSCCIPAQPWSSSLVRRVSMLSSFVPNSVRSDLSSLRNSAKLAMRLVSMLLHRVGDVVFVAVFRVQVKMSHCLADGGLNLSLPRLYSRLQLQIFLFFFFFL